MGEANESLKITELRVLDHLRRPRQVRLNLGGSVYDPTDAGGRVMFNVPAMVPRPYIAFC